MVTRRAVFFVGLLAPLGLYAQACSKGDHPPVATANPGSSGGAGGGGKPAIDAGPIAQAPPSRIVDGPVISAGAGLNEFEPDVAVSTTGVVAAAYIANGPGSIGYSFSSDDGATWTPNQAILSAANAQNVDPALASDGAGGFVIVWLENGPAGRKIFTASAPTGTTTFGAPVLVSDAAAPAAYDKPWVLVLADGTRVVVYTTDSGSAVFVARSSDGKTFTHAAAAPDGTLRGVSFPCTSGKRLYLTYLVPGGIGLSFSDDGGATWPAASTTVVHATGERAAFDMPTCAADADDVWVAYGITSDTNVVRRADRLDAIRIAHSTNGGASIASRSTVVTDAVMLHPHLARDAAGTLHLLHYGGKIEGDTAGGLRHVRSLDKGGSWTANEHVGPSSTLVVFRTGFDWFGDYVGVAARGEKVYTTYVQNQFDGGTLGHVAFARIEAP